MVFVVVVDIPKATASADSVAVKHRPILRRAASSAASALAAARASSYALRCCA